MVVPGQLHQLGDRQVFLRTRRALSFSGMKHVEGIQRSVFTHKLQAELSFQDVQQDHFHSFFAHHPLRLPEGRAAESTTPELPQEDIRCGPTSSGPSSVNIPASGNVAIRTLGVHPCEDRGGSAALWIE